jgi:pimeloyl-ACP methyl ester carboxylesterase
VAGRPDRRGDLPTLVIPTLVIVGAEDQVTPPSAARELACNLPQARLIEIPAAGHLSALEDPETVAGYVEAFLSDDPASR